jgi:DNA-binding transcriptional regulator YiaG
MANRVPERRYTPEEVEQMRRYADAGMPAKEAAALLGRSHNSVSRKSRENDISFHSPRAEFLRRHAGNRFAEARMAKGLTLLDVEADTGIAPATIRRWESGRQPCYKGLLETIAAEYGVTPEWLLGKD